MMLCTLSIESFSYKWEIWVWRDTTFILLTITDLIISTRLSFLPFCYLFSFHWSLFYLFPSLSSFHLFIPLLFVISFFLSLFLSLFLSVYLSFCLSFCLSISLSFYLSLCFSIFLSLFLCFTYLNFSFLPCFTLIYSFILCFFNQESWSCWVWLGTEILFYFLSP